MNKSEADDEYFTIRVNGVRVEDYLPAEVAMQCRVLWSCAACRFSMLSTGWLKCPRCKVQLQ